MSNPVPALLARWQAVRAEIRVLEEREHPDIQDAYGRRWVWKDGDLYVHDGLLAFSKDMISSLNLPQPGLAEDNPNYAALCGICRHQEPANA